jgi:predicted esterase
MTKKLFFIVTILGFLVSSCNGRLEVVKNNMKVLGEKELTGGSKYQAALISPNDQYLQSQDADEDFVDKCDFDFYYPNNVRGKKLPLVVYLHEGGFVTGDKSGFVAEAMSKDFARMGFAVANCNYRLINNPRALVSKESTHRYIMQAVAQVRLGIRNLKLRADELHIDTNKVYVIGWSAGGVIANTLLFTDREEALSYVAPGHRNNFIHNDAFDIPLNLAGVVSIGGALMADDVDDEDLVNTRCLLIHGTNDDMLPMGIDYPLQRFRKEANIDLPALLPMLTAGNNVFGLNFKIHIPSWMNQAVMNGFTTKVYGSSAILDLSNHKNLSMIEIKDGSHVFFMTDEHFNQNYKTMMKRIQKFIQ